MANINNKILLLLLWGMLVLLFVSQTQANSEFNKESLAQQLNKSTQNLDDSLDKSGRFYGGSGIQVIGYTADIDAFFTFYQFYGKYWYIADKVSYSLVLEPVRFNWTRLDSAKYSPGFDKARYFSFSSVLTAGIRYAFKQENYKYRALEFGAGFNLPWYYDLKKKRKGEKIVETYPNRYQDVFAYSRFQYDLFTIKAEYHPFDLIKNSMLPEPAKILIGLELIIASD